MTKSKEMWVILHIPSNSWDNGATDMKLYHAEYAAMRVIDGYGGRLEVWKPIKVMVTVIEGF